MIKRVIMSLTLAFVCLFGASVFAENDTVSTQMAETVEVAQTEQNDDAEAKVSSPLVIEMDLIDHPIMVDTVVRADFFDKDGNQLGMSDAWVGGITKKVTLKLDGSKFDIGDTIKVKFVGLRGVTFYENTYAPKEEITIETSRGTTYHMTGDKPYELQPVIYIANVMQKFKNRARIVDGVTMVPIFEIAPKLGLEVGKNDKYNSIAVWVGSKKVAFNIGSSITNVFGTDVNMGRDVATRQIDGVYYVPVRPFAEYFGCKFEVLDFGDHIDVCLGESSVAQSQYSSVVANVSSRTNWLIYVDKSDYKVRVYKGSKGKWILQKTYPCAIGAPGTPTITGQFEYQWKEYAWHYGTYYVGPIMRFYRGYALHSTLRYYGGGEYDGRVGVKISHGCVRLHPADIQWMWDTIPLYTKIYITE